MFPDPNPKGLCSPESKIVSDLLITILPLGAILKVEEIKTAKLYSLDSNQTVEFLKSMIEVDVLKYFTDKAYIIQGIEQILLLGTKQKSKANLLVLGNNINVADVKLLCGEIKEKYGFTINQMSLVKEQYDQMSNM